jgi:hypothetical protein
VVLEVGDFPFDPKDPHPLDGPLDFRGYLEDRVDFALFEEIHGSCLSRPAPQPQRKETGTGWRRHRFYFEIGAVLWLT